MIRGDRAEVFRGAQGGLWYWHRKSPNGQIVAEGEGYDRREDAVDAAVRENPGLPVYVDKGHGGYSPAEVIEPGDGQPA